MKSIIKKPTPLPLQTGPHSNTKVAGDKKSPDVIFYPVNKPVYKELISKIIVFHEDVVNLFFTVVFWVKNLGDSGEQVGQNWGLTIKFYPPGEEYKKRPSDCTLKLTWYAAMDPENKEYISLKPAPHCEAFAVELTGSKFEDISKLFYSITNK